MQVGFPGAADGLALEARKGQTDTTAEGLSWLWDPEQVCADDVKPACWVLDSQMRG